MIFTLIKIDWLFFLWYLKNHCEKQCMYEGERKKNSFQQDGAARMKQDWSVWRLDASGWYDGDEELFHKLRPFIFKQNGP